MLLTKKYALLLISILIISLNNNIFSQCCSAGSPVGATTHVGILDKGTLRVSAFYRHNSLDDFFSGTSVVDNNIDKVSRTNFNYTNINIAYGLSHRISIEGEAGYFLNKTQTLTDGTIRKGDGFSNAIVTLKYCFYNNLEKNIEGTAGLGLKIPFTTQPQSYTNGSLTFPLPIEIQPSTGATGYVFQLYFNKGFSEHQFRIFNLNRIEYNNMNSSNYRYGAFMLNSVYFSKQLLKNIAFVIEIRNECKQQDQLINPITNKLGDEVNTGNHNIIGSPKLIYSFKDNWYLSGMYDIPLYRNYIGTQMALHYSFAFSISKNIKL